MESRSPIVERLVSAIKSLPMGSFTVTVREEDGEYETTVSGVLRDYATLTALVESPECPRVSWTNVPWESVARAYFYGEVVEVDIAASVCH